VDDEIDELFDKVDHGKAEVWTKVGTKIQKRQAALDCLPSGKRKRSDFRLGLAETGDAVARFPLTALLEQVDAFEALEDVAFNYEAVGALEAFVL
jgi:hypothetical protein